jgi:hypothetical protein
MVGADPRSFVPPADEAHEYECPFGAANTHEDELPPAGSHTPPAAAQTPPGVRTPAVVFDSATKYETGAERPRGLASPAAAMRTGAAANIGCGFA